MTPKRIPRSGYWTGPYLGNYAGDVWKTSGMDFDKSDGEVSLSMQIGSIEDSTEIASLGTAGSIVNAFTRADADGSDRYWGLKYNGLLKTDADSFYPLPSNDWDSDAIASTPLNCLDFSVIGRDSRNDSGRDQLFVTRDTGDISVLNDTGNNAWTASWWVGTQAQPALSQKVPYHPIEYFPFRKIGLVGDGNLVHTISKPSDTQNDTVSYARLRLPPQYRIRHIFVTSDRAWFLCVNQRGGEGAVVEWDGYSESYLSLYGVQSIAPLSGVSYKDTPIILNSKGYVMEYTGRGFSPMIRNGERVALPIASEPGLEMIIEGGTEEGDTNLNLVFPMAPRSAVLGQDDKVYFNVGYPGSDSGDVLASPSRVSTRMEGGIWCLDPTSGRFYNKHSLITRTNDRSQLWTGTMGGILWAPSIGTTNGDRNILAGGRIPGDTSLGMNGGIWLQRASSTPESQDPTNGYIVTPFIHSDDVADFWDTVWLRIRAWNPNNVTVRVKARRTTDFVLANQIGDKLVGQITFTSTTTFTVTLNASSNSLMVGDEVHVLAGTNSSLDAHITAISGAHGALQTITIEDFTGISGYGTIEGAGVAIAAFDRWILLKHFTENDVFTDIGSRNSLPVDVGIDSSFIQFKIVLQGTHPDLIGLTDLIINSKTSTVNQV